MAGNYKKKESEVDYLAMIKQDCSTKEFKNIYVLYGRETYLIDNYKKALIRGILGIEDLSELESNFNYNYYGEREYSLENIRESANNAPFFAERKLIVIEDVNVFGGDGKGLDKILDKETLDTTYFIIIVRDFEENIKDAKLIDKNNAVYKVCAKKGIVALFSYQNEAVVKRWIAVEVSKHQKQITIGAVDEMIRRVGTDMQMLSTEIAKLLDYKLDSDTIVLEDVQALCQIKLSDKVYDMIEAMGYRNQTKALALYSDLLGLQVKPQSIMTKLYDNYSFMLTVKDMNDRRMTKEEIAAKTGKMDFIIKKNIALSGRYTVKEIKNILEDLANATIETRQGRIKDQLSLELIIVKYSTPQKSSY